MANRLSAETSPYLLQHAHNPVDWYPFGEEAFARAVELDRPILLSVGYAACHWCHVMERESFEDAGVAGLMNERFVSIKVDREERPDVDQIYQQACQLLTRHGGWPLTVFLTPDGRPFFAGTYFPPDERYGRPSFRRVLTSLHDAWQNKREDVEQSVAQILAGMSRLNEVEGRGTPTQEIAIEAAAKLAGDIDPRHGGFGGAPKFPHATGLAFLQSHAARGGDKRARDAVHLSLVRMAQGGIYDRLGGGFHRYSVDDHWAVPHFEKMLYDQGQLLPLYHAAWRESGNAMFRRVYEESVEYLLREMRSPEGAFYATQDADSEGEEGKFFVWTPAELATVLGAERASIAAARFGVTPQGNFEHGRTVLHIAREPERIAAELGIAQAEVERALPAIRADLLSEREKRVKPARDDKLIASWNGLVISALARSPEPLHVRAAADAARFFAERLWDGKKLLRTFKDGIAKHDGVLDDYAFFALSLVDLFDATQEPRWLELALALGDAMVARFYEETEGAFYLTAKDAGLIQRPRSSFDQATPAGVGIAAMLLSKLEALTGRTDMGAVAEATFATYAELMHENPFAFGSLCEAMDAHLSGLTTVVVIGAKGDAGAEALAGAVRERNHPDLLLVRLAEGAAPAVLGSLANGKSLQKGKPTAYVCQRQTCSAPVTDAAELADLLRER